MLILFSFQVMPATPLYLHIMRDITVLNLVIAPEREGGQIHLNVVTVLRFKKNATDTNRGLVAADIFYRECSCLHPTSTKTCGGHVALTSTTIFKKCGEKVAQMAGTLHHENSFGAPLPIFPIIFFIHDPFNIILQYFPSSILTETQLSITSFFNLNANLRKQYMSIIMVGKYTDLEMQRVLLRPKTNAVKRNKYLKKKNF